MDSIYVECPIQAPIDLIWRLTQDPASHERWDLRFSSIAYLPRADGEPQRFLYETRIGFGLKVAGQGESVGEANRPDGTRTSSLRFWSDEPISLICEGSGYWQYEPRDGVVRFRTRYDYRVRHGLVGRILDLAFRPIIGWATAWSFDSLRLWAEKGVPPEQSRTLSLAHLVVRLSLAFAFLWHGLVPKLLFPDTGEVEVSVASGFSRGLAPQVNVLAGVAECLFAVALVAAWRVRWLFTIQIALLLGVLLPLAMRAPDLFKRPFQPLTLNVSMAALALTGLIVSRDLPSSRNCRRRPA